MTTVKTLQKEVLSLEAQAGTERDHVMSQMRELTLNYDNASKHTDEMMIMNSELEKIFATEINIAMEKVSGISSRYNDATNSIAEMKRVNIYQENKLKNAVTEKEELERQHSELAATMDDMDSQLNKTSSEKEGKISFHDNSQDIKK